MNFNARCTPECIIPVANQEDANLFPGSAAPTALPHHHPLAPNNLISANAHWKKPNNCSLCDNASSRENNLRIYLKAHSRRKRNKCSPCHRNIVSPQQRLLLLQVDFSYHPLKINQKYRNFGIWIKT